MKKLPIVGSTAATTAFCMDRIDGLGGTFLYVDGNAKITRANGDFANPKPNAFSLPAAGLSGIEHCPGSTETCRKACYVEGLSTAQPALYALYQENATQIREILADPQLANDWAMRFAAWITQNAPGGFRWHVSGDCFSLAYAEWIADVCREAPTVEFWIYTRSFEFLKPLVEVSTIRGGNLAINLSADVDNFQAAVDAVMTYAPPIVPLGEPAGKWLRLAYLTIDGTLPALEEGDVVFPDYALRPRAVASLADSEWWQGLMPGQRRSVCVVDAHGKSEKNRCGTGPGQCSKCLT